MEEFPNAPPELECEHLIDTATTQIERDGAGGDKSWMSQVQKRSTTFLQTDATIARIK